MAMTSTDGGRGAQETSYASYDTSPWAANQVVFSPTGAGLPEIAQDGLRELGSRPDVESGQHGSLEEGANGFNEFVSFKEDDDWMGVDVSTEQQEDAWRREIESREREERASREREERAREERAREEERVHEYERALALQREAERAREGQESAEARRKARAAAQRVERGSHSGVKQRRESSRRRHARGNDAEAHVDTNAGIAGIGIQFSKNGPGPFSIQGLTSGGAAEMCGRISVGDLLHGVDDKPVYELDPQQTMELILGLGGSVVTLWISKVPTAADPRPPVTKVKLRRGLQANTPGSAAERLGPHARGMPDTSSTSPASQALLEAASQRAAAAAAEAERRASVALASADKRAADAIAAAAAVADARAAEAAEKAAADAQAKATEAEKRQKEWEREVERQRQEEREREEREKFMSAADLLNAWSQM